MNMPTPDRVLAIHNRLVGIFAESSDPIVPSGPVDDGSLLSSACSRPHSGYGKQEKYPTLELKCAALFHSLTKNHPFQNGNKRTALATLITVLYDNERAFQNDVSDDDVYNFVVAVAGDSFPTSHNRLHVDDVVSEMATWIKERVVNIRNEVSELRATEFIQLCEKAGAKYKLSGSLHSIMGPAGSVHFNVTTRKLPGPVVRQYLKRIGYTASRTGITLHDFQEGVNQEQEEIRRFRNVLDRLANT